jgi:hypothetical protein
MIKILISRLPRIEMMDFVRVHTSIEYILLYQLAGTLFNIKNGVLKKKYISSYNISENYKTFDLFITKDYKFNDGRVIDAEIISISLKRCAIIGAGVHFNPKRDLLDLDKLKTIFDDVAGIKILSKFHLQLKTLYPNPRFLYNLARIEATPVHPECIKKDLSIDITGPSCGPYKFYKNTKDSLVYKSNNKVPLEFIKFSQSASESMYDALLKNRVHYIMPNKPPDKVVLKKMLNKNIQKHRFFGVTYWLTINLTSSIFQEQEIRRQLFCDVRSMQLTEKLDKVVIKANQLFMGKGPGRLSKNEINQLIFTQDRLPKSRSATKINFLGLIDDQIILATIQYLKKIGWNVQETLVCDYPTMTQYINKNQYDIMVVNTDLCNKDLYNGLYNCFNPDRQLICDPTGDYRKTLIKSGFIKSLRFRSKIYKKIALSLLKNNSIAPICWYWKDFYASNKLNLQNLEGAEFWLVEKKK